MFHGNRKIQAKSDPDNGLCGVPGGHVVVAVHGLLVVREDVHQLVGHLPLPRQHQLHHGGNYRQVPLCTLGLLPPPLCSPEVVLHPRTPDPPPPVGGRVREATDLGQGQLGQCVRN